MSAEPFFALAFHLMLRVQPQKCPLRAFCRCTPDPAKCKVGTCLKPPLIQSWFSQKGGRLATPGGQYLVV